MLEPAGFHQLEILGWTTPQERSGGGAAATVAADCVRSRRFEWRFVAHSFCCGLVGIKPSRGGRCLMRQWAIASVECRNSPLARTVADATLLDVMSGYLHNRRPLLVARSRSFSLPLLKADTNAVAFATTLPPLGEADFVCLAGVLKQSGAEELRTPG